MADCVATTILIRHADVPENGGDDPDLSEAGEARAEALRELLRDSEVGAIIVTNTRRSQQTAKPLAMAVGIAPQIVELDVNDIPANVAAVTAKLSNLPESTTALVIGHTITLPLIIAHLGGPPIPEIQHREFEHLFVQAGGCLTHLRYRG